MPIGKLAGVTCGNIAAFADRLQAGEAFKGGAGAVAFVAVHRDLVMRDLADFLVLHAHGGVHRHDLIIELA